MVANFKKSRREDMDVSLTMIRLPSPCRLDCDKLPNRSMSGLRISGKIMMTFAGQYHELCVRDRPRQMVGGFPVRSVGCAVVLVIANQHQGRRANVFQAICVVVFLPSKNEMEVILQRRYSGHSDLQKILDQVWMRRGKFFGPTCFDGVLADVSLEAQLRHAAAHAQRNPLRVRMRGSARSKNQFFYFKRMIECQELRHDAAHGMAADDCLFNVQRVENRHSIFDKQLDRIFLHGLAGLSRAAIIEDNDLMIAREFRHLMKFPGLVIATGHTAKKKRRALAVDFVVDFRVLCF
jgi:hypothetical protein